MKEFIYDNFSYDQFCDIRVFDDINVWSAETAAALPVWPVFCGSSYWKANYWLKHCNYGYLAIELVYEGSLEATQDGKTSLVLPGEIYIIHRGYDCKLATGPTGFCRKQSLGIKGSSLDSIIKMSGLSRCTKIQPDDISLYAKLFSQIKEKMAKEKVEDIANLATLAFSVISHLSAERNSDNLPSALVRAMHIIEYNLQHQLDIRELSLTVGMSVNNLTRLFKKYLATTPKKYHSMLKLDAAKQMLSETRMPIKEIAYSLGYNNQLYFSNDFKKREGISPSQYRAKSN